MRDESNLSRYPPPNYSRLDFYIGIPYTVGKVLGCTRRLFGLEMILLNCGAPSGEKLNYAIFTFIEFFAARGAIID